MRNLLKKIWFPATVVLLAAVQSVGMDVARLIEMPSANAYEKADTVIYDNSGIFEKFRDAKNRIKQDSSSVDSLFGVEEKPISARDTIKAPDSLRLTDPFRYKYYVALVDSLTHVEVRDSLMKAGDSLTWRRLDSIYYADSAILAKIRFDKWYAGLSKAERKKYDFEQKMKRRQARMDSILNVKDSLLAIKDSIRENTPRILETFAVPHEKQFERILLWNKDRWFNNVNLKQLDTSYNYWYTEYPFMKEDIDANYLGVIGSPVQHYDFQKRIGSEGVVFYSPYETYSYSAYSVPMYNTKVPYTELAYWGTLLSNTEREEANLHILTTQNITPALNLRLEYNRFGSNGMLLREDTDNRTFAATANYLGKRYLAHLGYISNKIERSENGGIVDNFFIKDTLVNSREINVRLVKAENVIKKKTFFLDQTYRIPFSFIKDIAEKIQNRKAGRDSISHIGKAVNDSTKALADSTLAMESPKSYSDSSDKAPANKQVPDTLDTHVTTAFIGHNSEYSIYTKKYTDQINATDKAARDFYNNQFFIHPALSSDSLRVTRLENKVFLKLQPWSPDAIVSSINAGIGNRLMSYYMITPDFYLKKPENTVWNSTYAYGGAQGKLKRTIDWRADAYYTFLGHNFGDLGINAHLNLNFFPFRRFKDSPVTLYGKFTSKVEEPDFYENTFFSNHLKWNNDFDKKYVSKIEGGLSISHWKLKVDAGYTLLKNHIFYDTLAIARQQASPISIAKLSLEKNFRLWLLHFDNRALMQISSNRDVLPLPYLSLNLRWYLQFDMVKDVLQMQLGANALYTSSWYAPAYNPISGTFFNQNKREYGNSPYIDLFVNMQWKRATIFVKLVNANMGWPMDSADYFSADGYIRPQRVVKLGIYWPFYLQTRKNPSVTGKAGSSLGGGSSSDGGGSLFGGAGGLSSGLSGLRNNL